MCVLDVVLINDISSPAAVEGFCLRAFVRNRAVRCGIQRRLATHPCVCSQNFLAVRSGNQEVGCQKLHPINNNNIGKTAGAVPPVSLLVLWGHEEYGWVGGVAFCMCETSKSDAASAHEKKQHRQMRCQSMAGATPDSVHVCVFLN